MKIFRYILAIHILIASILTTSCKDDLDFGVGYIGDGEALVEATVEFKSISTNLGSRSEGLALDAINTVSVLVYNADETKSLYGVYNITSLTKDTPTNNTPSDYPLNDKGEPNTTDGATAKVNFPLGTLPYGKYYIYAVVNLDREFNREDKDIQTVSDLKKIQCQWDPENISNNSQMFGYFTTVTNTNGSTGTIFGDQETGEDPAVIINSQNVTLYSWVRRLASKVTVAYDGSGLNDNVTVYIHNVSIRQIPYYCSLGDGNKPTETSDGWNPAEGAVSPAYFQQSVTTPSQVLYYNQANHGYINPETGGVAEGGTAPQYNDFAKYKTWMAIGKGSGLLPANPNATDADASQSEKYPHFNSSPALFFYENMQGDYKDNPEYAKYDKTPDPEIAAENWENGTISGPETDAEKKWNGTDYKDNVPCGTFIEVEAYYTCSDPVSSGPIRYRFMLGQNTTYNYNSTRNHHYKVTLGFNGYANQPDWHIEYEEDDPDIFASEIYIPYTYNTAVKVPIRIKGNGLQTLEAQIIENNWAPYDEDEPEEVPAKDSYGTTNFKDRTLEFLWYRSVFLNDPGYKTPVSNRTNLLKFSPFGPNSNLGAGNSASNYLYGRHPNGYYHLKEDGTEDKTKPYYVTPIWAGFFRLLQPEQYNTVQDVPAVLLPNTKQKDAQNYGSTEVLRAFRDYYFGKMTSTYGYESKGYNNNGESGLLANYDYNATDLSYRTFTNLSETKEMGDGLNDYGVEIAQYKEEGIMQTSTTVTMNLWTQPKSMCGISGFSGNNPYEDFNRKGVIRFTAHFKDGRTVTKDVTVIQAKRLVNPKAVWRSYNNNEPFDVTLMERDLTTPRDDRYGFTPVISRGPWSAKIIAGNMGSFAINGGTIVTGSNQSQIQFQITFLDQNLTYSDSKSAIIEVRYHNNTCVHNIFVRHGYNEPTQLSTNNLTASPLWSSFNLYSFTATEDDYRESVKTIPAQLTCNPLSFGAFFKKGNYAQGISVSNIERNPENMTPATTGFGPLQYPNGQGFYLTGINYKENPNAPAPSWANIDGITGDTNWQWAPISVLHRYSEGDEVKEMTRTCHVPTIAEFNTLLETDFGIGVLYGDGATAPGTTTAEAFGFLDPDNTTTSSNGQNIGMRGFICYNSETANQIFFPIGTSGIGRRTTQNVDATSQQGTLRYSSVNFNLNGSATSNNTYRPICVNMSNAPGSIYWADGGDATNGGWEMNYFDLNFNAVTHGYVSGTDGNRGSTGDAIPIRLVVDPESLSNRSSRSRR